MEKSIISGNGVPIYYYQNEHLHSFCIALYIKAGSMYEENDMNGSTHLWEHILFRKLNFRFEGNFYKKLDSLGLIFSACTYKEFVVIKMTGATAHFDEAAKIIAMVFEPIKLSSKEIDLEKKRVKSEKREAAEESSLDYFSQKIVWGNSSLSNTILGKNKVIDKLGIRALQKIQNQILSEGNLFFYVTGCFFNDDIALLCKYIELYQLEAHELHQNIAPVPKDFFNRNGQVEVKNSYYTLLRFTFDIDISKYKYAELDLLYDILFNGDNSKIYQELSEKAGYIYSFDARLERYNNLGNIYFSFEIQRKNIVDAVRKIVDLLKELKTNITDELFQVIPAYVDNADFDLDDAESLNWNMAYECHIMRSAYKSVQEKKEQYRNVTPQRMMEIANEIFIYNNLLVTLKTNKKAFHIEEVTEIIKGL